MQLLEAGAPSMPGAMRSQALDLLQRVQSDSATQTAQLARIREALAGTG
jgi:hypothetical protein